MTRTKLAVRIVTLAVLLASLVGPTLATPAQAAPLLQTVAFSGQELLGRPTDSSIMITIVPYATIEVYYEYGTSSGAYTGQTITATAAGGQAHKTTISGLSANTKYYYRMQYRTPGGSGGAGGTLILDAARPAPALRSPSPPTRM